MAKSFNRPPVFLSDEEVSGNHHGQFAYRTAYGGRIRFDEFDKLGRLTGVYYQPENEKDRTGLEPRRMVVKYSDNSNRPFAIWFFTPQGFPDKHFCFQYKTDGSLKTVYYWGNGGNTNKEYHYEVAQKTVTITVKKRIISKTTSNVVIINGIESFMLSELPNLMNVNYFYNMYNRDRRGNDLCACFDVLGIHEDIYYSKYNEPEPKKGSAIGAPLKNPADAMWLNELLDCNDELHSHQE
jgi:hypothetical protein